MTEKRFKEIISTQKVIDTQTGKEYDCLLGNDLFELINTIAEENEQLKTQLFKEDDVCDICKHQYLVESQKVKGFYIAKCEKEHEECGKGTVKHCEDFECKEDN